MNIIELNGKYNSAKVFTGMLENEAISQILGILNNEDFKDSKIRIMPDCHVGKNCVIGFTMEIKDKVCVNLVGGDIGCGVLAYKLKEKEIDFEKLELFIRDTIAMGENHSSKRHKLLKNINLNDLKCKHYINLNRGMESFFSLGGGNHFIEVDRSQKDGALYLIVHTGSRALGSEVAKYYQKLAERELVENKNEKERLVNELKAQGREKDIKTELERQFPKEKNKIIRNSLTCITGSSFNDYIHDMNMVQEFSELNRRSILDTIVKGMNLSVLDELSSIHNYIDTEHMILRKGAISAQKDESLIIPMNMKYGCIIGKGKGNIDTNFSAPHGAGRVYSRSKAKEILDIEGFKNEMDGVWTRSVTESTIDESPKAYKSPDEIIENLGEMIEITDKLKSIYNIKSF